MFRCIISRACSMLQEGYFQQFLMVSTFTKRQRSTIIDDGCVDEWHLMSIQSRVSIRLYHDLTSNYEKYGLAARAVDIHPILPTASSALIIIRLISYDMG